MSYLILKDEIGPDLTRIVMSYIYSNEQVRYHRAEFIFYIEYAAPIVKRSGKSWRKYLLFNPFMLTYLINTKYFNLEG